MFLGILVNIAHSPWYPLDVPHVGSYRYDDIFAVHLGIELCGCVVQAVHYTDRQSYWTINRWVPGNGV